MSEFLSSYVLRVLFATPSSAHGANTTAQPWHRLAPFPFEPHRQSCIICAAPAEWREKHGRGAGQPQHN